MFANPYRHGRRWLAGAALCALLCTGCGAGGQTTAQATTPAAAPPAAEATAPPLAHSTAPATGGYTAPPLAESEFDPAAAVGESGILIDTSRAAQGYVAVQAQSDAKLKFQVVFGDIKYNYDLPGDGTTQYFPLQSGSGSYTLRVMQNTSGNKYAQLYAAEVAAELADEFQPFLHPSQLVPYTADSDCVAKAAELAATAADDVGVVANVYEYICQNIHYDVQKAQNVPDGYLPDPDTTLAEGSGICFDYAALAAAMLRSQGIPTKLMTGYVSPGEIYHAWNMIYLQNTGWITVNIEAPAHEWERIDLTFAAGADAAYTGDGTGYTDRYTY